MGGMVKTFTIIVIIEAPLSVYSRLKMGIALGASLLLSGNNLPLTFLKKIKNLIEMPSCLTFLAPVNSRLNMCIYLQRDKMHQSLDFPN
jgi:hypothetical protein